MTDINNNMGTDKIGHVQSVNFASSKANPNEANNPAQKEITNLDNAHSALVGRSMVKKMQKADKPNFDGRILANIKGDIAELDSNPKLVKKAMALSDLAIAQGCSPEKAAKIERYFFENNQ